MPPGRHRLAFDLVLEHRYWLSEIGNSMLEVDVEVGAARRDHGGRASPARRSSRPPTGTSSCAPRTRRASPRSAARSTEPRARAARLPPRRRPQPGIPGAARLPVAPAPARAELRGRRAARRGGPRAGSRGSTTAGSQLDCDPVVDAPEHPRPERERDDRLDAEVDDVPDVGQLPVEERVAQRVRAAASAG